MGTSERSQAARMPRRPVDVAWVTLPFLLPAVIGLASTMGSTDLAYHVRTGELILNSGDIPRIDTFTFSMPGTPWLDQQWGAQVVLALAFRFGGWATLLALQGLLAGATFWIVSLACRARGASPRLAGLLTIGAYVIATRALVMRPQLLALPLVAAAFWALASRSRSPRRVWLIPVLAAVTANVHGSFVLFPLLVGLAWIDDLLRRRAEARATLVVGLATVAATLVNPFGFGAWSYVLDLTTNPAIRDMISEWAPITVASVPGLFLFGSVLAVTAYFARRADPVPWVELATLGVFLFLALSAQRAITWWAIAAAVVLSGLLAENRRIGPRTLPPSPTPGEARAPAAALIGTLILAIGILLPWWRGTGYEEHLREAPPGLTRAVQDTLPSGTRLLVHQPWGSWFEYATPDKPVFVDSRIEIMPDGVVADYVEVGFAGANWAEVLERWEVDAIVAKAEDWELIPNLRKDPRWRVAYEDEDGVLFVRA